VRLILGRNIAHCYGLENGADPSETLSNIQDLLRKVADGAKEIKTLDQLRAFLQVPLRIHRVYKEIGDYIRTMEAVATAA